MGCQHSPGPLKDTTSSKTSVTKGLVTEVSHAPGLVIWQRCQTLHALNIKDMYITKNNVEFIVTDLLKTSKPGKQNTKLEFRPYDKDPSLCAVSYLTEYFTRTTKLRMDKKLLISYQKPHKAVSKDTVGRWLKMDLKSAGIDTSIFGALST